MAVCYVVDGGTDAGSGANTFGTGYLTLQYAITNGTTGSGNTIIDCRRTETITAQLTYNGSNGAAVTSGYGRIVTGSAADGTIDSSLRSTIVAGAAMTRILEVPGTVNYIRFEGFIFDGNSDTATHGVTIQNGARGIECFLCTAQDVTSRCWEVHSHGTFSSALIECIGTGGAQGLRSTGVGLQVYGGKYHHNAVGVEIFADAHKLDGVQVYRNTGLGIEALNYEMLSFTRCTIVYNDGHGLNLSQWQYNLVFKDNIVANNSSWGIFFENAATEDWVFFDYNLWYSNGSGNVNLTAGVPGDYNQTTDPEFTSVVDGSEDFTPSSTASPCVENGLGAQTIGALNALYPTLSYAAVGDVRTGVDRGDGAVGTMDQLAARYGIVGQSWGTDGTEVDGAFVVPAEGSVVSGLEYGYLAEFTGSFICPAGSSGGLIDGKLAQVAVYWAVATKNKYGNPATYTAGVQLDVRWQNIQVLFTDPQGEERQSSAVVYFNSTAQDVRINDRLWLGTLASLSGAEQADPTLVENTWRIQQEGDSPSLGGGDVLGKVFL